MVNEFCANLNGGYAVFIMANDEGNNEPPEPDPQATGVDLAPWVFGDYATGWFDTEREIDFNVYNIGSETATTASNWSYIYVYYNAFDADDYGVIVYDQFNTSVPQYSYDCITDYNCIFNYPIAPGGDFASEIFGSESVVRTYYMPEITGFYYLLFAVDAEDVFQEQDEMNNLFYTTDDPVWFTAGIILKSQDASNNSESVFAFNAKEEFSYEQLARSKYNTTVNEDHQNAYTPEEIMEFFKQKKKSGELETKFNEYLQRIENIQN